MKRLNSILKRLLSPAMVVAVVALCSALGGSATAALVVTGSAVKDGSLTGKDVRNRSLGTRDLSPKTVGALRGHEVGDEAHDPCGGVERVSVRP